MTDQINEFNALWRELREDRRESREFREKLLVATEHTNVVMAQIAETLIGVRKSLDEHQAEINTLKLWRAEVDGGNDALEPLLGMRRQGVLVTMGSIVGAAVSAIVGAFWHGGHK